MRAMVQNEQWEPCPGAVVEARDADTGAIIGTAQADLGGIADFSAFSAITTTSRTRFRVQMTRGAEQGGVLRITLLS